MVDHLDILAAWGEQETVRQERRIQQTVAAVLHALGKTEVTITHNDVVRMLESYDVECFMEQDPIRVTTRLVPK